jgi:hypothetical protein
LGLFPGLGPASRLGVDNYQQAHQDPYYWGVFCLWGPLLGRGEAVGEFIEGEGYLGALGAETTAQWTCNSHVTIE